MPCTVHDHRGEHYWPDEGEIRIWPCERICGFCPYQARDSSGLRAHVREHHAVDHPDTIIQPGLHRPPVFDPKIHGRTAMLEAAAKKKREEEASGTPMSVESPSPDGPSSAIARGRLTKATAKAAEAAAQQPKKKRKTTTERIPGEIFPARQSKRLRGTAAFSSDSLSGPPSPASDLGHLNNNSELAETIKVNQAPAPNHIMPPPNYQNANQPVADQAAANGTAVAPRSPAEVDQEGLYNRVKGNLSGLLFFADASGLSRARTNAACQDALNEWMFGLKQGKAS